MENINTVEYWNNRYNEKTGNWNELNGKKQSQNFMETLIEAIPNYIKNDINSKKILDYGSGIATGTEELAKTFNKSKIIAVDFSEIAVKINKRDFPHIQSQTNIEEANVVISSNVIEHTNSSFKFMKLLSKYAKEYIIVLAPYDEDIKDRHEEHIISITEKDFPDELYNFKKIFQKINIVTKYWMYNQILVIYKIK